MRELERVRAGELRGTPLLLTIAARVYLEHGALPEHRAALYERFVSLWLAEASGLDLAAELGERLGKVALPGLARLALAMTEAAAPPSPATLKQVWQRAVSRWADERWREVALFALGLLSDAGQDVTALVGRIWPGVLVVLPGGWPVFRPRRLGSAKALPFARAVLAEQVQVGPRLSNKIIATLLANARQTEEDVPWITSVFTELGELRGYPRVGDGLLALARDEQVGPVMRAEAARVLEKLGRYDDVRDLRRDYRGDEWLSIIDDAIWWAKLEDKARKMQEKGEFDSLWGRPDGR